MRRSVRALLIAVPVLFLAPFAFASAGPGLPGAAHAAPLPYAFAGLKAAAPTPKAATCPTPASAGHWGNGLGGFFNSINVQFYVPGSPELSGDNFNTIPCGNTVPTYLNGFYLNLTTDVPLISAQVTIWGLQWALPTQTFASTIPGYSPGNPYDASNSPTNVSMYIVPPLYEEATFYFNDYKNFWPGSTVYFNVTVTAANESPAILRSGDDLQHSAKFPAGTNDFATWQFTVGSPWTSNNFTDDIAVSTTPDVLGSTAYDPNPQQPFQITLRALDLGSGTTLSIPEALLYLSVYRANVAIASYQLPFGPANHSVETLVNAQNQLPFTLGPFSPGETIVFNVTAWVPWEGGSIDRLYSPFYSFNTSAKGGWWEPHAPLESVVNLSMTPGGINGTPLPLNPLVPVNVTLHEAIQNVTIGNAFVKFLYHDAYGRYEGTENMTRINANTTYLLIPGLPPGGNLTFSVLAKDIYNDTVSSQNYSYYESGALQTNPSAGFGYLFFEAVDLSTGTLVAHLPYTVANSTWSERSTGTALGFGGVLPPAGLGYLPLAFGNYTISVYAFGLHETAVVNVTGAVAAPIVFYFTTAELPSLGSVSATTFPFAATIGIAAAALAVIPIRDWFKERRKKAEAEQKRISL